MRIALLSALAALLVGFAVVPALSANTLNGEWNFVFQTPDGERRVPATLQVEGSEVSGKFAEVFTIKGNYADTKLDLTIAYIDERENLKGNLNIRGNLADGKLAGNWEFAGYTGTFQATRPK